MLLLFYPIPDLQIVNINRRYSHYLFTYSNKNSISARTSHEVQNNLVHATLGILMGAETFIEGLRMLSLTRKVVRV